ncbi:MAG: hypothetical protein A2268_07975 [Candidatus Raymondbacteria bacterium RifOxyA12_full_50_37]|uniref:Fibronectin type-III domain-containing protein n=1 Tax=Candidatus Raymondbacteria bacterium RIFOXYD12_FULL_49_13 TaxID=1817890 RepID=A0A1F7FK20_UNCRA|nr:MAG: hypothetical protein A2350_13165 [Candidatus Raymondbacteria bacterium RifOxyB12_full_50_8]OGJ91745.1 MAG: hypothetical protein A2268_07975 [Candidatus Raymondbacteria bacterium RifOxyA12_full_50_37]OGJ93505.1 MAG: hypothetical protein A2248_09020 [Candidatus Raymondbacteria bacterium RIFOXYA2_FULL_49_16]OGJ98775.1 MAG: hypothetical protein A2453_09830 [Candidatus Raymondbacteria bacterium RIFOXYC2_FULL_50_21]OGK06931.1 MAG: hypothetical protein A2519_05805 [Candidatus Raymondbacteria b
MNKKTIAPTVLCLCAASSLLLWQCGQPSGPDVAGNTSETGNALVSGYVYNSNGSAAQGATIRFVAIDHNPYETHTITDSTFTDSTGWYGINTLPFDTYNVFAAGVNDSLGLQDSVAFTGDTIQVPENTIKTPGSMAGYIKLLAGDEPDKIIAIAMGSNTFSFITTSARFSFADLAEGQYNVKFLSLLPKYSNLDTVFHIFAGANIDLGTDSIVIPLKIPIPTGFAVKYDSMTQRVTLLWNKMNPAKVSAYNVYREHAGNGDSLLTPVATTDTFYVDSNAIQDETYIYRVASVNAGDEEGVKTRGDSVTIVSAYKFLRVFAATGTNDGQVSLPQGITIDSMKNVYVVDLGNWRIQKFDRSGNFLMKFGSQGNTNGQFSRPQDIVIDKWGKIYITDADQMCVHKFNSIGSFVTKWSTKGLPSGIAIDYSGRIYVATQSDSSFIQVFDTGGVKLSEWKTPVGNLDIAIKDLDTVFVSSRDNKLTTYLSNGTLIQSWTINGLADGFRFAMDKNNNFFIPFWYTNDFVRVFNKEERLLGQFGKSGAQVGYLYYPVTAYVDGKNVFICANNGIQIFTIP